MEFRFAFEELDRSVEWQKVEKANVQQAFIKGYVPILRHFEEATSRGDIINDATLSSKTLNPPLEKAFHLTQYCVQYARHCNKSLKKSITSQQQKELESLKHRHDKLKNQIASNSKKLKSLSSESKHYQNLIESYKKLDKIVLESNASSSAVVILSPPHHHIISPKKETLKVTRVGLAKGARTNTPQYHSIETLAQQDENYQKPVEESPVEECPLEESIEESDTEVDTESATTAAVDTITKFLRRAIVKKNIIAKSAAAAALVIQSFIRNVIKRKKENNERLEIISLWACVRRAIGRAGKKMSNDELFKLFQKGGVVRRDTLRSALLRMGFQVRRNTVRRLLEYLKERGGGGDILDYNGFCTAFELL